MNETATAEKALTKKRVVRIPALTPEEKIEALQARIRVLEHLLEQVKAESKERKDALAGERRASTNLRQNIRKLL